MILLFDKSCSIILPWKYSRLLNGPLPTLCLKVYILESSHFLSALKIKSDKDAHWQYFILLLFCTWKKKKKYPTRIKELFCVQTHAPHKFILLQYEVLKLPLTCPHHLLWVIIVVGVVLWLRLDTYQNTRFQQKIDTCLVCLVGIKSWIKLNNILLFFKNKSYFI
jgi:hypothetical protein